MATFMTEAAERGFREAIQSIEGQSSAEVVIAVRARLRRSPVPYLAVAAVLAASALAFVLFSETEFELWEILVLPVVAGALGGMAVELLAPLERVLVSRATRLATLREAACAAFYELGVHATSGRTGLLAFFALREREVLLVGDLAVVERVGEPALVKLGANLAAAIAQGGEGTARALAALGPELAAALPRSADDVNELSDAIHAPAPPPARRFRGGAR